MSGKAVRLINSDTIQVHIQGFEWAYPNIGPIYQLLKLVLQNQRCRISTTQDNNRIVNRSSRGESNTGSVVKA